MGPWLVYAALLNGAAIALFQARGRAALLAAPGALGVSSRLQHARHVTGACPPCSQDTQGSPLGREFGVFVERARVSMLGLVPSIAKVRGWGRVHPPPARGCACLGMLPPACPPPSVQAWRSSNCMEGLDWSALRCFSSTGEASAPEDCRWLSALGGYSPVIEYCGGARA